MRPRENKYLTPDLTPLIDVVFLLLIFFLVSSVFKRSELALLLNLPTIRNGEKVQNSQQQTTIEISNNKYAIDGEILNLKELESRAKLFSKSVLVFIRADVKTEYGRVIKIFDILKHNQIQNISLVTDKKSK